MNNHRLAVALVAALTSWTPLLWAQGARPEAQGTATGAPVTKEAAVKIERGAGGKKIYKITEAIKIEGKIQKPEAFYVLQKSSINYDWQELKKEFLPKILDSVSKAPF